MGILLRTIWFFVEKWGQLCMRSTKNLLFAHHRGRGGAALSEVYEGKRCKMGENGEKWEEHGCS